MDNLREVIGNMRKEVSNMQCAIIGNLMTVSHQKGQTKDGQNMDFWRGAFEDDDAFMESDKAFFFTIDKDLAEKLDLENKKSAWVGKKIQATGSLSTNRGFRKFKALEFILK